MKPTDYIRRKAQLAIVREFITEFGPDNTLSEVEQNIDYEVNEYGRSCKDLLSEYVGKRLKALADESEYFPENIVLQRLKYFLKDAHSDEVIIAYLGIQKRRAEEILKERVGDIDSAVTIKVMSECMAWLKSKGKEADYD